MRLNSKLIAPQMMIVLLFIGAGTALWLYLQNEERALARTVGTLELENDLSDRVAQQDQIIQRNLLSYRIDRKQQRLDTITRADIETAVVIDSLVSVISEPRGRELIGSLTQNRNQIISTRNDLLRVIQAEDEAHIPAILERWTLLRSKLDASLDDLEAYQRQRFQAGVEEIVRERVQFIRVVAYGVLLAIAVTIISYLYLRRDVGGRLALLTAGIRDIGSGKLDSRLDPRVERSAYEIGEMARTLRDVTARLRASYADLDEGRARLAGLIDSAMDGIVTIDEAQNVVLFNPAAEHMFRCGSNEALGQPIDRFIPDRFRAAHRVNVGNFGSTGVTFRRMGALGVITGLRADGEEFPIEASISQLTRSKGRLYTVILRDIAERKRAEDVLSQAHEGLELRVEQRTAELRRTKEELRKANEELEARVRDRTGALRESEERYHAIFEQVAVGIVHTDLEGHVLNVNRKFCDISGYSPQDVESLSIRDLTHSDDIQESLEARSRLVAGSCPAYEKEVRIIRTDGTDVWAHITTSLVRTAGGQPAYFISAIQDISERKRVTGELRESELRFRELAENIRQVFFLTDPANSQMLYISPAYEEIWGRSCESLYVQPASWMDSIHPDDRATVAAGNDRRSMTGQVDYEYRIVRPDGRVRWIWSRGFPICNDAGEVYRVAGLAEDITERKEAAAHIDRLNRIYAVLSGINAMIVRVRNRDELFREACRVAVDHGHFRLAWVGTVDPASDEVAAVASAGEDEGFAHRGRFPLSGDNLVAQAMRSQQAMVCNDIERDTRTLIYRDEMLQLGYRSLAGLPIVIDGRLVGVIALYAAEAGFFDDQEMRLLRELAGDVAFALDHIAKEEKLNYLAFYDPLTGVANRNLFCERLAQWIGAATHDQQQLAVVVLDIERFNTVNDTLGRQTGDELLKQIAARCETFAADPALFARLVGDQFAVVIPDVRIEDDVARIVEQKDREIFGASYWLCGADLRVSAKFGIAVFPGDGTDADTLLKNAEAALKRAKATGERYLFYTQQMTERVAGQLSLENKLRHALENDEFVLHYQPKVDVETRRIVGVEALMRWQNPELGLVPPLRFIPLLEETGMILDVGAWALRRAALDHRGWLKLYLMAPRIAVNVSAVQLRHRDFVDVVRAAVRQGANPPSVDIEITETVIMGDIEATVDKLRAIRDMGLDIAIDDFGTGYSSLGYLTKLPIHSLKIDRSFILTMTDDPDTMTLVSTIISLAHSLRLKVCAEGVETEEQAKVLRLLRCDQMQGYLISPALPLEEVIPLLTPSDAR